MVAEHLYRLGLRCSSEPTQASLMAMLVQRETSEEKRSHQMNPERLRNLFLTVKAQLSTKITKLKNTLNLPQPHDIHLESLPANPQDLPAPLLQYFTGTFGDFEQPRLDMIESFQIARAVDMRQDKKKTLELSVPGTWSSSGAMAFNVSMQPQVQMAAAMMASAMFQQQMAAQGAPITLLPTPTQVPQPRHGLRSLVDKAEGVHPQPDRPLMLEDQPGGLALQATPLPPANAAAPSQTTQSEVAAKASIEAPLPDSVSLHGGEAPAKPLGNEALPLPSSQETLKPSSEALVVAQAKQTPNVSLLASIGKLKTAAEAKKTSNPADTAMDSAAGVPERPHKKGERESKEKEAPKSSKKPRASPKVKPAKKTASSMCHQGRGMKRPVSKMMASQKDKAKDCGKSRMSTQDKKKLLRKHMSKKDMDAYSSGCAKCRYVAFCTLSCWRQRGYCF